MKVVYQDAWVPARALELIEDEGVTWTMGATPFVMDSVAASASGRATFQRCATSRAPALRFRPTLI